MFFRGAPKKEIKEDEELLSLYKASGDLSFLGELYERYAHLIFGVCMKYLQNKEDSMDMSMQIFEKLAVVTKTTEVKNFRSWLHVLTKNECLMLIRSRPFKMAKTSSEINGGSSMELEASLHPPEEDTLETNLQELELAIEELPPEQKECIRLFYLDQKSYKEITGLTGYDLNKVKSYIQNGKRNLKLHMQKLNE